MGRFDWMYSKNYTADKQTIKELNYEGYEKHLIGHTVSRPGSPRESVQYLFKFDNGYGASVVKGVGTYGYREDLWELSVLIFDEPDGDPYEEYCSYYNAYDTPITDDVLGYLSDADVRETLDKIKELPDAK